MSLKFMPDCPHPLLALCDDRNDVFSSHGGMSLNLGLSRAPCCADSDTHFGQEPHRSSALFLSQHRTRKMPSLSVTGKVRSGHWVMAVNIKLLDTRYKDT